MVRPSSSALDSSRETIPSPFDVSFRYDHKCDFALIGNDCFVLGNCLIDRFCFEEFAIFIVYRGLPL